MTPAQSRWTQRFDVLHEKAATATGLSDFGDADYHEGFNRLLAALEEQEPLAPADAAAAEGIIVGTLQGRLVTQAGWKANPDYRDHRIERPVVVMGIPRTGTTALYNLLSLDPQFQGIEKWLCYGPTKRPPREEWAAHSQFKAVTAQVHQMHELAPEVMVAHGVQAEEVDECILPMAQSFIGNWFPSNLDVPAYDAWFRSVDETPSFRRYADVLKLVGGHDPRRWLLKNPSHVFGINALLAVFPDACVIQTHRDPRKSIASLINLLDNIKLALAGTRIDRIYREAREASFWAQAAERSMAAQERQPERFVNVKQTEIRTDPMGVVHRIYARFGLTLTPEAQAKMEAWARANPPHAKSAHAYEGLSDPETAERLFAPYIAQYDL
jgi:hypothetical protein